MGMIRRGSLPRMAVTCAGLSSLTRSGPELGRGEGRVIASAGSLNVRSGSLRRRAILAVAAIPLFLIAIWVSTPALPRTARANLASDADRAGAADGAVRALERAVSDEMQRLDEQASRALDAPADAEAAFPYVAARAPPKNGQAAVVTYP